MALVLSLLPVVILINSFIRTSAFGVDESEHSGEKLQDYLSKLRKIRMLKRKESNMDARLFEASLTALETTNLSSVTQINKPALVILLTSIHFQWPLSKDMYMLAL